MGWPGVLLLPSWAEGPDQGEGGVCHIFRGFGAQISVMIHSKGRVKRPTQRAFSSTPHSLVSPQKTAGALGQLCVCPRNHMDRPQIPTAEEGVGLGTPCSLFPFLKGCEQDCGEEKAQKVPKLGAETGREGRKG